MLFALATSHKIGLACMGGAFIIFALISSFVLPARNPSFPGKWLRLYLAVCVAFFVAMIASILILAKEKKVAEAAGAGAEAPAAATQSPTPTAAGDPVAGKAVFKASPCASCHKFTPAGTSGAIGPDLDNLKESAAKAGKPLVEFIKQSITDPNAYVAPGYSKGVMPPNGGATLTSKQLDDLVAFLAKGP
jgi:mono/diheme cytochrome c family protein